MKTHPGIIRDLNTAVGVAIRDRKKYGYREERLQKITAYLEKFTGVSVATIKFDDAVCSMVLDSALVTRDRKLELHFIDGSAFEAELHPRRPKERDKSRRRNRKRKDHLNELKVYQTH